MEVSKKPAGGAWDIENNPANCYEYFACSGLHEQKRYYGSGADPEAFSPEEAQAIKSGEDPAAVIEARTIAGGGSQEEAQAKKEAEKALKAEIKIVKAITDPDQLRALLEGEGREKMIEAINSKLAELEASQPPA